MKCPSCAATIGALDRVCEYCGAQVPVETIASVAAASEAAPAPQSTAAELCDKIQEDLAALAQVPPASSLKAVLVGLLTPPTLGIAYVLVRIVDVMSRKGFPPSRLIHSIDENLRKGKIAYKNDPNVVSALNKGETELASYHAKSRASQKIFLVSCLASLAIIAAIFVAGSIEAKRAVERREARLRVTVELVGSGDMEAAMKALTDVRPAEQQDMVANEALVRIPLALLDGKDADALEMARGIPDPIARAKALNFIGARLVASQLKVPDYPEALRAASVLTPDETRIQSEDSIRGQQAKAFIDANQMDEAKKIIANIADEKLRASLDAAITAKLPKAGLNGF